MKTDIITDKNDLAAIMKDLGAVDKSINVQVGKKRTREEIVAEINKQRHEAELKIRIIKLQQLYDDGEFYKLKQETLKFIKEGYANKKIKFYLEKVIRNEGQITQKKLEQKMQAKYTTLREMYKKGQYDIVVNDCIQIIAKNGKI